MFCFLNIHIRLETCEARTNFFIKNMVPDASFGVRFGVVRILFLVVTSVLLLVLMLLMS